MFHYSFVHLRLNAETMRMILHNVRWWLVGIKKKIRKKISGNLFRARYSQRTGQWQIHTFSTVTITQILNKLHFEFLFRMIIIIMRCGCKGDKMYNPKWKQVNKAQLNRAQVNGSIGPRSSVWSGLSPGFLTGPPLSEAQSDSSLTHRWIQLIVVADVSLFVPSSLLLPPDLGFLDGPEVGVIDHVLLVGLPRGNHAAGGKQGVLLVRSWVILSRGRETKTKCKHVSLWIPSIG